MRLNINHQTRYWQYYVEGSDEHIEFDAPDLESAIIAILGGFDSASIEEYKKFPLKIDVYSGVTFSECCYEYTGEDGQQHLFFFSIRDVSEFPR